MLSRLCYFMSLCIYFQDRDNKANELRKLEAELAALGVAAKEGVEAASKVKNLEKETKVLNEENKVLTENYNTERVRFYKHFFVNHYD